MNKASITSFVAAIALSITASIGAVAQPGPMPVVSGLSTPGLKKVVAAPAAAVSSPGVAIRPVVKHDCAIFYMGAGGNFYATAIRHQAENFRRANPNVRTVEVRRHQDFRPVPAECKNPLLVGHSMGALRAMGAGNEARRGRVISIDPPNWFTGIFGVQSLQPTVNFFSCPPSPFGCGKVPGARNVDLSKERRGHVRLPYSPLVTQEVTR